MTNYFCSIFAFTCLGEQPLRAGNEPGDLGVIRRKLIDFLQTSEFYNCDRLLSQFRKDSECSPDSFKQFSRITAPVCGLGVQIALC